MNKYLLYPGTTLLLLTNVGCKDSKEKIEHQQVPEAPKEVEEVPAAAFPVPDKRKSPEDFLPEGYVLFEKVVEDLNKDGLEDCVLIIKGTDKDKIIKDEYRGKLDRNRRGILVLLNKNVGYELVVKNYECFSSENEDGWSIFCSRAIC